MARIVQAGWELGDVLQLGAASSPSAVLPTVVSATPAPRSGTYALKIQAASGSASGWSNLAKLLVTHASKTELYYAFGIYRSDTESNTLPSRASFATYDTSGNVNTILMTEGDGSVRAYYANAGTSAPGLGTQLTLIGTSATSIANTTWTLIEVHLVAATGATGTCEVKINGTTVITATSQRTCQLNANFGAFHLGWVRQSATGGTAGSFLCFDDLRVNDTTGSLNTSWPGDETIRLLVPTAAGDLTQLSRGGTDSGANWSQVDEVPAASADYVTGASVGLTDLYNTTDFPVSAISAITVLAQVSNSDGGGGTVYLPVKTGAGQSDGTAVALTASWTYQSRLLEADPADAAAWTSAKLSALQLGLKVAS
jgi:hypothetical protein